MEEDNMFLGWREVALMKEVGSLALTRSITQFQKWTYKSSEYFIELLILSFESSQLVILHTVLGIVTMRRKLQLQLDFQSLQFFFWYSR
jgi:hypothetical protein